MIVPSMSKEEVIREMLSDFDIVRRKSEFVIKEVQRQLIKSKKYPFAKAYDYITPKTKNTWIYWLEFKSKNDIFQSFVCCYYTSVGLMAGLVSTDMEITLFTGHFFSRFAEREGLNIINPIDKIKKYFLLNPVMVSETREELEGGAHEIIGKVNTGVILGVRNKKRIMICNTYLSHAMLGKDQALIADSMKIEIENYNKMKDEGAI